MHTQSTAAYDHAGRVATYDRDMEVMHPNRRRMAEVVVELISTDERPPEFAIDLGAGTGFLTLEFLRRFPTARVLAIDGAPAMVDLARARLGPLADRVEFVIADFRRLQESVDGQPVDAVFSAFALHHLTADEKYSVLEQARALLADNRWFVNADIIVSPNPGIEARLQALRVRGIGGRAGGSDPRWSDDLRIRAFLDEVEASDGDRPLSLAEDLELASRAGLRDVTVFWQEYREVVYAGLK